MKIGVIGYGNLAKALLQGISNGNISKSDITITAKSSESILLAKSNGFCATESISKIFENDLIIIAVKPVVFNSLIPLIPTNFTGKVVSTMACYSLSELKKVFKNNSVLRIMPSLLSSGGNDIIATCGDSENFSEFISLLKNAGKVVVTNEEKFNAYLVAVSCGIGFSAYIVESYNKALKSLDLTNEESQEITKALFTASANLSNREEFYNKVATKGGVTERGLTSFNESGLNEVVEKGILSAYEKVK